MYSGLVRICEATIQHEVLQNALRFIGLEPRPFNFLNAYTSTNTCLSTISFSRKLHILCLLARLGYFSYWGLQCHSISVKKHESWHVIALSRWQERYLEFSVLYFKTASTKKTVLKKQLRICSISQHRTSGSHRYFMIFFLLRRKVCMYRQSGQCEQTLKLECLRKLGTVL